MGALDDLLAKGYAAAAGDEPAADDRGPAPSMSEDTAALLGRTPASATRRPPEPTSAAADVAALSGKSPGPAPAKSGMPSVSDAVKYGVNLAGTAADKISDIASSEGLRRNPTTGEWEVSPEVDQRPWYKQAGDAVGAAYDEGLPWLKRKAGEVAAGIPAYVGGAGHGVSAGLAPEMVSEATNLKADVEKTMPWLRLGGEPTEKVSPRELQVEHEKRAAEHPVADFAGDVSGSGMLSAMTGPGAKAGPLARLAGNTMNSVGQYLARNVTGTDASEPWKKRINTGAENAVNDPLGLGFAAATPALAEGVTKGLGKVATSTSNAAKDAYSHLFLPPGERALLRKSGGDQAVRELVGDAQAQGLLGGFVPTAGSIANRAGQLIDKSGTEIGGMLDNILAASKTAGGVADTSTLTKTLRDAADHLILNSGRRASDAEVTALEDAIQRIDARGIKGKQGQMDLERAVNMLKDFQKNTNYDPKLKPREPIEQAINMTGWKGLKDATSTGIENLETQGHLPAGTNKAYKDLQKSYHVAQGVHYPALQVSEKIAQQSGADPSTLLGAALMGGQFGTPAAIGVTLGGVPRGVSGRLLDAVSGAAKGGSALSQAAENFRLPQALGKPLAEHAKERNDAARAEIRQKREELEKRAKAKNDLERSVGARFLR